MYTLTTKDAERLLTNEELNILKNSSSNFEKILQLAQQPPEMGPATEDDYKRVMLNDLLTLARGGTLSFGEIPGIGGELGMIQGMPGETKEEMYDRLERLTGGKVIRP